MVDPFAYLTRHDGAARRKAKLKLTHYQETLLFALPNTHRYNLVEIVIN
jgi:hypothetical protein